VLAPHFAGGGDSDTTQCGVSKFCALKDIKTLLLLLRSIFIECKTKYEDRPKFRTYLCLVLGSYSGVSEEFCRLGYSIL
jgi:hypothetical protein